MIIQPILGVAIMLLATLFGVSSIANSFHGALADLSVNPKFEHRLVKVPAVIEFLPHEQKVRGLTVKFPRLADSFHAKRTDFHAEGTKVSYLVQGTIQGLINFYTKETAKYGWFHISDNPLIFQNNQKIAIRINANPISDQNLLVRYDLGRMQSAVLGVSTSRLGGVFLAQTDGGSSPPSTSYSPPPSGPAPAPTTSYTPPPSDTGTYTQPTSGTTNTQPSSTTFVPLTSTHEPYTGTYPAGSTYPTGTTYPAGTPYPTGTTYPVSDGSHPAPTGAPQTYPYPGGTNQPYPDNQYQGQQGQYAGQYPQHDQYGQQGQFGQQGPFGQQGEGMQAEMEKQMQDRMLEDMKRHMGEFVKQISFMKKKIPAMRKRLQACGADFPEEFNNALGSIDGLVEKIKAAQDPEEVMTAMESLQDAAMVFQDMGPQMGDYMRYCEMVKRADREVKRIEGEVNRTKSRAKAQKKIDASELIAELDAKMAELKGAFIQAKAAAKTSIDESIELLESGVFENMDNVRQAQEAIFMVLNVSTGLKQGEVEVRNLDRRIAALARKKVDVAPLKELMTQLKEQMKEVKKLASAKPIDIEALKDGIEIAFDYREQLFDAIQQHEGESSYVPKFQGGESFNFDFHDSFLQSKSQGSQEGFGGSQPGGSSNSAFPGPAGSGNPGTSLQP